MWLKEYRDYKQDQSLIKNQVSSGKGIIGCEMHDLNGWGATWHQPVIKKNRGILATLFMAMLTRFSSRG